MVSRCSFLTTVGTATAAAALTPWSPFVRTASAAGAALPVRPANRSGQDVAYAYISGTDSSGWPVFLSANGALNRLPNPSSAVTPIADYSIAPSASGSAGTTVTLTDYIIGGRVWDVGPTGSAPVDGHIQDGAPISWSITLGTGDSSSGGYRRIRNKHSDKVMGVDLMSTANSAHVVQYDDNGTDDHLRQFA